ncbi:cytochrome b/b6 domain-containing protein [Methylobacillus gramineus]|uniref:cytochrome b/b6 domain-containing protein n=1 Tax=Methylobacillus gramineus TaxID=755169 RepID=UPI001CFFED75|nr:cytochrome b/b6 domain-containing protein [Methylobacillus gramineus]MCB5183629.1 cytochrome b/b6 domain-containing protein [Methylobacillus gramineus]
MKHINTWDFPLRFFHWSLVALFAIAIITVKIGGNALEWHVISGEALLALLIFRVLWGFAGGTYAKFSNFIRGPRAIIGYLKGTGDKTIGHNPLGGWSVIAMLLLLLAQAVTGLFSNDDIFTEGPLYSLIDKDTSDYLTYLHTINQYILYGLIGLHIAAIIYYRLFKRENLVKAMITGRKQVHHSLPDTHASQGGHVILGSILLAVSAGIVWFIATHWA